MQVSDLRDAPRKGPNDKGPVGAPGKTTHTLGRDLGATVNEMPKGHFLRISFGGVVRPSGHMEVYAGVNKGRV